VLEQHWICTLIGTNELASEHRVRFVVHKVVDTRYRVSEIADLLNKTLLVFFTALAKSLSLSGQLTQLFLIHRIVCSLPDELGRSNGPAANGHGCRPWLEEST
jgi:hypothetical protein